MSNAASDISGREWDGSSPLLRGGGERGPRIGGRRRACYKSTFIQRGEKRGREKRKKVHYWFPVKSRHRSGGGKRKPFSSPFDGGGGGGLLPERIWSEGKRPSSSPFSLSLSRQFFSSLLITDTSFRFRSNEPWSLGEREREREWKSEYSSPWKNILENDRNPPGGCRWYRYTNSIRLENDSQEKGVVKRSIRTNVGLF